MWSLKRDNTEPAQMKFWLCRINQFSLLLTDTSHPLPVRPRSRNQAQKSMQISSATSTANLGTTRSPHQQQEATNIIKEETETRSKPKTSRLAMRTLQYAIKALAHHSISLRCQSRRCISDRHRDAPRAHFPSDHTGGGEGSGATVTKAGRRRWSERMQDD